MADKVGALEPGKLADLVLVNGSPTADIELLKEAKSVAHVMKDGVAHKNELPAERSAAART